MQAGVARRLYGRTMVEHIWKLGLLKPKFSGAHSVWFTTRDIELLAEADATVIHTPLSNLYLGSGIARVPELIRQGISVGIGSDGPNCGSSTSLFEVMKLAAVIHRIHEVDGRRWISARDAFRMATIGGAKALGLDEGIGSLEVGKKADLVLLNANTPNFIPLNDPVVHGRKIKVSVEDDAGNPEKAKAAVKKLIYDTKVFALMGTGASLAAFAAKKEIEEAKVPWLGAPAVMDKIYIPAFPTTFSYGLISSVDARSMAKFMVSKPGVKKIGFVYHFDDWGKGLLESATKVLEEQKVEWSVEVVEKGITDATAVILKVKKYNPDVIIGFLYPTEGPVFIRDAYKYGLKVPIVFNTALSDLTDVWKRAGIPESMRWVFASTYGTAPVSDPRFSDLMNAMKGYFPVTRIQPQNFIGFAGGRLMVEALKRCGRNLSREKFLDVLENMKDFETGVLPSKISFSKTDHVGLENCTFVTLKKDGTEYYLPEPKWDTDILKKKNWETE